MELAPSFPIVTDQDHARLSALINAMNSASVASVESLRNGLARAHIVPQSIVPPDVVTMHSVVTFTEVETGQSTQVALVYPQSADVSMGLISILDPIGTALLGLRVGNTIEWTGPSGRAMKVKLASISFQPEAVGAFEL